MPDLSILAWAVLALATVVVGLTKSAIPGAITIAVALYAAVLPAKESTGAILVILILGDLGAILMYRRTVSWATLVRLIPAVVLGLALGYWFLAVSNDSQVAIAIAVILLLIIGVGLIQTRRARTKEPAAAAAGPRPKGGIGQRLFYGGAGGFMTMIANAAGPALSMYFLTVRLPVRMFLGTMALFFAILNIIKLPFSITLGLITMESLAMNLALVPALAAGFAFGRFLIKRIQQEAFEQLIIVFTVVGALYLLVHGIMSIT